MEKEKEKGITRQRLLIVDDHKMYRDALKKMISRETDMEVVGEAEDGKKAVVLARDLQPDIILMDVRMPVMDGIEATRRILAEKPDMKILALSVSSDGNSVSGMMRAGALGYIMKGGDFEELSRAIRRTAGSQRTEAVT
ncbi:MAG TPA: response regulator transcription factor [Syntrophales bacterium]|nr:response regulator transcription factor [Syntrophales bacterium]HPI57795.1 response regulator transcription factor [Syntrophales bacterium]HPN25508.1 response regulator transcription factor [Syntrophales bacterium]HQM28454.1 response regulator transcription factor [Syntrophales bacterium]